MGVRGMGRESWMEPRALGMSRVEEEEAKLLQIHVDTESTQPAGVKGPSQNGERTQRRERTGGEDNGRPSGTKANKG